MWTNFTYEGISNESYSIFTQHSRYFKFQKLIIFWHLTLNITKTIFVKINFTHLNFFHHLMEKNEKCTLHLKRTTINGIYISYFSVIFSIHLKGTFFIFGVSWKQKKLPMFLAAINKTKEKRKLTNLDLTTQLQGLYLETIH